MAIQLVKLTPDDDLAHYQALQEIKRRENGFDNPMYQATTADYQK